MNLLLAIASLLSSHPVHRCAAKVLSFKPNTQKHEVQFEDGEREWVDLLSGGGRQWTEKLPKK